MTEISIDHIARILDPNLKNFLADNDALEAYCVNLIKECNRRGYLIIESLTSERLQSIMLGSLPGQINRDTIGNAFNWAGATVPHDPDYEEMNPSDFWSDLNHFWRDKYESITERAAIVPPPLPAPGRSNSKPRRTTKATPRHYELNAETKKFLKANLGVIGRTSSGYDLSDMKILVKNLNVLKYPLKMKKKERKAFWLSKIREADES